MMLFEKTLSSVKISFWLILCSCLSISFFPIETYAGEIGGGGGGEGDACTAEIFIADNVGTETVVYFRKVGSLQFLVEYSYPGYDLSNPLELAALEADINDGPNFNGIADITYEFGVGWTITIVGADAVLDYDIGYTWGWGSANTSELTTHTNCGCEVFEGNECMTSQYCGAEDNEEGYCYAGACECIPTCAEAVGRECRGNNDCGSGGGCNLDGVCECQQGGECYPGNDCASDADCGGSPHECIDYGKYGACQCDGAGAVCGNGVIDAGEECDDGDAESGDGCSSTCMYEIPICSISPVPWYIDIGESVNINFLTYAWVSKEAEIDTGAGFVDVLIEEGLTAVFSAAGNYVVTGVVYNPLDPSGETFAVCTGMIQVSTDGACGAEVFMQDFYQGMDEPADYTLCDVGIEHSYTYVPEVGWTRYCEGENNGAEVECFAYELYCGDGEINGANTTDEHLLISKNPVTQEVGNAYSFYAALSQNGRRVAFSSDATNLIDGETDDNDARDVFVYDIQTDTIENITLSGSDDSGWATKGVAISDDGNIVAFSSDATNLIDGETDTNNATDVFVYKRDTEEITNITSTMFASNDSAVSIEISADGRWIVFDKINNVTDDNGIYLYDTQTEQMTALLESPTQIYTMPSISADGRYIVFEYDATAEQQSIGVYDTQTSTLVDTIVSPLGEEYDNFFPSISVDGRYVVFYAFSASDDAFVIVYDRSTDTAKNLTQDTDGKASIADISADGRWVTLMSEATNLVDGEIDDNGVRDIFVYDLHTDTVQNLTLPVEYGSASTWPVISADGNAVVYLNSNQVYLYGNTMEECDDGANGEDNDGCNDSCQETSNVSISKSVSPEIVYAGQAAVYELSVTSEYGTATNIVVTDTLPAGQTIYAVAPNNEGVVLSNGNTTVTWTIDEILAGTTKTLELYVTVSDEQSGVVTNTASMLADDDDNAGDNSDSADLTISEECGTGYDTYSINYAGFSTGYFAGDYLDESHGRVVGNFVVYKNGEIIAEGDTHSANDGQGHSTRRYTTLVLDDAGDRIDTLLVSADDGLGGETTYEIDIYSTYGCEYAGNIGDFATCVENALVDYLDGQGYTRYSGGNPEGNYHLNIQQGATTLTVSFYNRHNPSVAWVGFDTGTVLTGISNSLAFSDASKGASVAWDAAGRANYTTPCGEIVRSFNAWPLIVDRTASTFNELIFHANALDMTFYEEGVEVFANETVETFSISCPVDPEECEETMCGEANGGEYPELTQNSSELCEEGTTVTNFVGVVPGDIDYEGDTVTATGYIWQCENDPNPIAGCIAAYTGVCAYAAGSPCDSSNPGEGTNYDGVWDSMCECSTTVAECGDGIVEGGEACEHPTYCDNGDVCDADSDCTGIGDELCQFRRFCEDVPSEVCSTFDPCSIGVCGGYDLTSGCEEDCTLSAISCDLSVDPAISSLIDTVTGTITTQEWVVTADIDWSEAQDLDIEVEDGVGTADHLYENTGSYIVTGIVYHPLSGEVTAVCTESLAVNPLCGDGVVNQLSEECDGTANCTSCQCDEGFESVGGVCLPEIGSCGNNVLDDGEECDIVEGTPTFDEGIPAGLTCDSCYAVGVCGDGYLDLTGEYGDPEQCDDENTLPGDGCSSTCQIESIEPDPECGDGSVNGLEQCDPSAGSIGCYGPSDSLPCMWKPLVCATEVYDNPSYLGETVEFYIDLGDYITVDDFGEFNFGDGNRNIIPPLQPAHIYTNGGVYEWSYEIIHEGNDSTMLCTDSITIGYCGDGNTNGSEQCDDGNSNNNDGCKNDCTANTCGDGEVYNGVEACDNGEDNSDTDPDACRTDCSLPICGDDVQDTGESCDGGVNCNNATCECDSGFYDDPSSNGCIAEIVCGSADDAFYYTPTPTAPHTAGQGNLCTDGNTGTPVQNNTTWEWSCTDEIGCEATNHYCGDGNRDNIEGGDFELIGSAEECDDGANGVAEDGCSDTCMCDVQVEAGTAEEPLTCQTEEITLQGSSNTPGATYQWTTEDGNIVSDGNTATPVVNAAGTYVLTVTAPNGCTAQTEVIVTEEYDLPTISVEDADPLLCTEDGSITFTFTDIPDGTYTISYDGGQFENVEVQGGAAIVTAPVGVYNNLSISLNSCESSDDPDVTINAVTCIDGVCGEVTPDYNATGDGSTLTEESAGLCVSGEVDNFAYDTENHVWTWDCVSTNGGSSEEGCTASESRCGDTDWNSEEEECDGDDNCTETCQCADGYDPDGEGNCVEDSVVGVECGPANGSAYYEGMLDENNPDLCGESSSVVPGSLTYVNDDWQWQCENNGDFIACSADGLYCGDSVINGEEVCDEGVWNGEFNENNNNNGTWNGFCNDNCVLDTTTPSCYYDDSTNALYWMNIGAGAPPLMVANYYCGGADVGDITQSNGSLPPGGAWCGGSLEVQMDAVVNDEVVQISCGIATQNLQGGGSTSMRSASGIEGNPFIDIQEKSQILFCEGSDDCKITYKSDEQPTPQVVENQETVEQTLDSLEKETETQLTTTKITSREVTDAFARALYIPVTSDKTALQLLQELGFFEKLAWEDGTIMRRDLVIAMMEILTRLQLVGSIDIDLTTYEGEANIYDLRRVAVALRKIIAQYAVDVTTARPRVAIGERGVSVSELICRRQGGSACSSSPAQPQAVVPPSSVRAEFTDVDPTSRVGQAIKYVNIQRGIFQGVSNDQRTFDPEGAVQVGALFKTFALALELQASPEQSTGPDWAKVYLEVLQKAGYLTTVDPATVAWNHSVTRGELQRYLTSVLQTAQLLPSTRAQAGPNTYLQQRMSRAELVIALQQLIQLLELQKAKLTEDLLGK